ncbi:uncharacterized protein HMPREF1541_07303 [Cyphellophora europaea CBS 101466]|uniref:CENP-V/GFA domain-containing protein n=1 Tax=Cyphellophora europaea (strain CBS 101466) TaxID=1220924 RepID=W2RMX6_CYPE1|nr:uncharacterized protein HMPREF1541_07303 [Cyphellophora europaea CBS 101466]ETN37680.1 hypothetical protein HMPREF1541_07303 [Cyphellophora europaea CBS 101466]
MSTTTGPNTIPSPSTSTTFTATCHCASFNHTLTLPTSAFPLKSALCHCTSCRHVTGHLFATFAVIPGPLPSASLLTHLTKYPSSELLDRYFCPVCGASVLNVDRREGEWELCTGVMEFEELEAEKGRGALDGRLNRVLLFVEDTGDGGAVQWLGEGRAEAFGGRFMRGRGSEVVTEQGIQALLEQGRSVEERGEVLDGRCHCGDVKVDLLQLEEGTATERDMSAEFCCCTSCRKTSGFEVNAWAHWPKEKVRMASGDSYEAGMKEMGHYLSSKDTHRYFCKRCGATVFYDRPDLKRLDIALGLFNAPEGSRAENWFTWNPDKEDVAYLQDAIDKEFVGMLANGVGSTTRQKGEKRVVS